MSADEMELLITEPQSVEAAHHARLLTNPFVADEPKRRVAKMTPAIKHKFCDALANGASPTKATNAIGIARSTAYYQRSIDPEFAEAWEEALERAADLHEDALHELSVKTKNVGAVIFQLKNRRPQKWQDRHDVNVEKNETVTHVHELGPGAQKAIAAHILELEQSLPALPVAPEKRGHAS